MHYRRGVQSDLFAGLAPPEIREASNRSDPTAWYNKPANSPEMQHALNGALHRAGYDPPGYGGNPLPEARAPWNACESINPPDCSAPSSHTCAPRQDKSWQPRQAAERRPLRRRMNELRRGVRYLSQPRVQACGRAVIQQRHQAPHWKDGDAAAPGGSYVSVVVDADGRARLCGLAHCGSVWECPSCQLQINMRRGVELRRLAELHGKDRLAMLTLTVRHGMGDNLKELRGRLARALDGMINGAPWKRFKDRVGWEGQVRALEVTHGPNGWHPHFHLLVVLSEPAELATALDERGAQREIWDVPGIDWLRERWQVMVGRYVDGIARKDLAAYCKKHNLSEADASAALGRHVPDLVHGLLATPVAADYLAKMGCELADPGHKAAHDGHRTPLRIAFDWTAQKNESDARLWRIWCADMRGARKHVWSNGLRRRFGMHEHQDHELIDGEEPSADEIEIYRLPAATWNDFIRDKRTRSGVLATTAIIEAAELGGARAVEYLVLELVAGEER